MPSWVPALMSLPITDMAPDRGLWVAILMVFCSFSQPAARSRKSVVTVGARMEPIYALACLLIGLGLEISGPGVR